MKKGGLNLISTGVLDVGIFVMVAIVVMEIAYAILSK